MSVFRDWAAQNDFSSVYYNWDFFFFLNKITIFFYCNRALCCCRLLFVCFLVLTKTYLTNGSGGTVVSLGFLTVTTRRRNRTERCGCRCRFDHMWRSRDCRARWYFVYQPSPGSCILWGLRSSLLRVVPNPLSVPPTWPPHLGWNFQHADLGATLQQAK